MLICSSYEGNLFSDENKFVGNLGLYYQGFSVCFCVVIYWYLIFGLIQISVLCVNCNYLFDVGYV